jgi:hypothetical protein
MPEYTYECNNCKSKFSVICSISNYKNHPKCECGSKKTERCYIDDCLTINGNVRKSDSELKTIGDLALRNTERMSEDQKADLHNKHNSYKENKPDNPLPTGMSRMKRPKKTPKNFLERLRGKIK